MIELFIPSVIMAFSLGIMIGVRVHRDLVRSLNTRIDLLKDSVQDAHKMNDILRQHTFDMKNVNGGSLGYEYKAPSC